MAGVRSCSRCRTAFARVGFRPASAPTRHAPGLGGVKKYSADAETPATTPARKRPATWPERPPAQSRLYNSTRLRCAASTARAIATDQRGREYGSTSAAIRIAAPAASPPRDTGDSARGEKRHRDHHQKSAEITQRAGFVEETLRASIHSRIQPHELRSVSRRRRKLIVKIHTCEKRRDHRRPIQGTQAEPLAPRTEG